MNGMTKTRVTLLLVLCLAFGSGHSFGPPAAMMMR